MKFLSFSIISLIFLPAFGQNTITPKDLIELNRVHAIGMSSDNENILFSVGKVNIDENKKSSKKFIYNLKDKTTTAINDVSDFIIHNEKSSPDNTFELISQAVKLVPTLGTDLYDNLPQSNMMVYNSLDYRHWDQWEDGSFNHVFIKNKSTNELTDIMEGEKFDCPTLPFGGGEDYIWTPDGKSVLYVSKKLYGTEYAKSTNTDIYQYFIESKETKNLTIENKGYDMSPSYSEQGSLAYLQMKRDGYESDKNDIIILKDGVKTNLTKDWDGTVNSFFWSKDSKSIYFSAPTMGTVQIFKVNIPTKKKTEIVINQISDGQYDVGGIFGETDNLLFVHRKDMNHASEIFSLNKKNGEMIQITNGNTEFYNSISLGKVEKRITKATDGKDLLSWVIYPPNFDPNKKYPTLLYCQGGPQGALSQFYSYRWNFQLMAAHGYIIIAPNRRGMPGYGVEWNEQISKDYGGQNMRDYLSAIDDISTESYVDTSRLGCIGASYGGYSAFYLATIHENRFKTFIAHDGIFNWKSMYGTTEELFFVNWDLGGAYWDKDNSVAQKSHTLFNPSEHVEKWNTPIMVVQGGKDFRVPIGQGLEAFQAAQLQGIKSRLLFFPEENHWVLDYQNSLIWHTEFYKWLKETM